MDLLYTLRLDNGARLEVKGADNLDIKLHDQCVIRKDFYQEQGEIVQFGPPVPDGNGASLPTVIRKSTVHDLSMVTDNAMRAKSALRTTQKFIESLKLEMKLLNGHFSLDGKLLTIQFTADGRVDFRELVKELSRALNTRIELRQIGVRDETAIHGGISICGQELCCARFLKAFSSINVKMAKEQDLSLTPSSISGVCGRLKCCLKYEHEGYLELEKTMPRRGDFCECEQGKGRICDRNLLTQTVTIQLESGNIVRYPVSDIKRLGRRPETAGSAPDSHEPGASGNNRTGNPGRPEPRDNNNNRRDNRDRNNSNKANFDGDRNPVAPQAAEPGGKVPPAATPETANTNSDQGGES